MLEKDSVLSGRYQVIDRLGAGGMGTVYTARDLRTGRVVAVKVLKADIAGEPLFLRRFRREAEIARSLKSPHVVEILDAGVEDGTPFIAMELVEGESLAELLKRSGPLTPDQASDVALQVAEGLDVAHQQGVVHRDISPQNILITPEGTAKIADFGIARSDTSATLTATAAFIGKPAYAAPETYSGQADIRSDIYSLSVVMFEMLTGRPPFLAPTPLATMDMHARTPPPRLDVLGVRAPGSFEDVILMCLNKDPDERFQTPEALINALRQVSAVNVRETAPHHLPPDETQVMTVRASEAIGESPTDRRGWFTARRLALIASGVAAIAAIGVALFVAGALGGQDSGKAGLVDQTSATTGAPPASVTAELSPTTTGAPSPSALAQPAFHAPSGYPVDPNTKTLRVVGTRGSRSLAEDGPTVQETSERIQLLSDEDAANASGWNCATHVNDQGQPAVDWYLPEGTPVVATMDGTATVYVNTVANTFSYYGVENEPYLGNPDPNAAVNPFGVDGSGGKGVWVEIRNDQFTVNAAHLDLRMMVDGAIPKDAFDPPYNHLFDFDSMFRVPEPFTVGTAIAAWRVRRGDLIGYSGSSGYAEGPQLHYEILRAGSTSKLCPTLEPGYSDSGWLANADPDRP